MRKREGLYYLGNKQATILDNYIIIAGEKFKGTPGLWELLMTESLDDSTDYENYKKMVLKTNVLHQGDTKESLFPKSSRSEKWVRLLSHIWKERKLYEGKGVVVIPKDPYAL